MKKLIVTLLLLSVFIGVNAQITTSVDISAVTTDSTYYFPKAQVNYSYPMGIMAHFSGVTGTGGSLYFLNSATDTLEIVMPSGGAYTVNSDTSFALISDGMPFAYYGFKLVKGSLTAGTLTFYLSRKTSK